ncbi:MAG: thioredoxin domain-containing protein [Minisyncoccia bacterium]
MQNKPIVSAIIIAGVLIAGAILLKGSNAPYAGNNQTNKGIPVETKSLAPIGENDHKLGNPEAKVTLVVYEDFQCPFCGAVSGSDSYPSLIASLKQRDPNWTPFLPGVINDYVKKGEVLFVYRDWAFLGPESTRAAEAARCAGDQGKFWEYHDYLYAHQKGENEGDFADTNLKSFAKTLKLDTVIFDKCLDESKYAQAVADSKTEGLAAGVTGTPKGFILKDGKISSTIDGAESYETVKLKIEAALK